MSNVKRHHKNIVLSSFSLKLFYFRYKKICRIFDASIKLEMEEKRTTKKRWINQEFIL